MLGAIVNVPDLSIVNGRVVIVTERLGGYSRLRVSFNPKEDEINPSTVGVHENEVEIVDGSKVIELGEPEFDLGDKVHVADPLDIDGIVGGISHSVSGCIEYEVYYKAEGGLFTHTLPAPLLEKTGVAATPGTQTGSMLDCGVQRRD